MNPDINGSTMEGMLLGYRVRTFYDHYLRTLNDGRLEEWPDFFVDEGRYFVTSAENEEHGWDLAFVRCESRAMIQDRLYALQNAATFEPRRLRRMVGNQRLHRFDGGFAVRSDFVVTEARLDQKVAIFAAGVLDDVLDDTSDVLRFRSHVCILDDDVIANSLILPL